MDAFQQVQRAGAELPPRKTSGNSVTQRTPLPTVGPNKATELR